MNNLFKLYSLILILIAFHPNSLEAQCKDVTVNLDQNGHYTLKAEDILYPFYLTEKYISFSPREFTCDDIGDHEVDVLMYRSVNDIIQCTSVVTVQDVTPPEAKCFSNLHVILDGQGQYEFTPQAINQQSTDACSEVGFRFFPPRVTCTDPNPMNVLFVARDASGNLDTCNTLVSWDAFSGPTQAIACKDSVVFKISYDDPITLTADMVFQDIIFGCAADYTLELFDGGNLRPEPVITYEDTNAILTATITDPGNGSQCTATIIVLTNIYCEKPLPVCDTECHNAPVGDCTSGHSLQDEVEWPCDIVIEGACPFDELYPNPDNLIWYGFADLADVKPAFGFEHCLFEGFWDEIKKFPTEKIFVRHWTVLSWPDQQVYDYVQNITLKYNLTEICDTLPWNAPTGNCESGHTLSDDVEWPADISIHSPFSKPENLMQNDEVLLQNVRPQVSIGCNVAEVTYFDVVTAINDLTLLVARTWVVQDVQSLQTWQYVQHITIMRETSESVVCVSRENGQAIPGVRLIPGILTDVKGCHHFENPAGIVVIPVKDAPLKEGVNIQDQIAIKQYTLGLRTLSEYQLKAADLNQDGIVNSEDIIAIDQILDGSFIPPFPHNWKFYEVISKDSFADISNTLVPYYFIGVKMGDVITAAGEEEIFLVGEDEVLNQGETYDIPLYLDRNALADGFGIQFTSPGHAVEFLDVLAPQIPGFDATDYNIWSENVNMIWIASPPYLGIGVPVAPEEPFLILRIKANENIILHEAISLGTIFVNEFIPPSSPYPLTFRLYWGEEIISSTVDLGNGRKLDFYPNPVMDELHIQGFTDQDQGFITLLNSVGQIMLSSPLQEKIDITSLHSGIYYISVLVNGNYSKAVPVIKIQH